MGVDTIDAAVKLEALAWALVLFPKDIDRALTMAGYNADRLTGVFRRQTVNAKYVKRRVKELGEAGIAPGAGSAALPEAQDVGLEDMSLDGAIRELWRMVRSDKPPPGSQVTALNHVVTHLTKLAERGGDDRPDPLHMRIQDGAFKHDPGVPPIERKCWFCGAHPDHQEPPPVPEAARTEEGGEDGAQIRQLDEYDGLEV